MVKANFGLALLLAVTNITYAEKEVSHENTRESDAGRVVEELEMPEGYAKNQKEIAEAFGIGIEDLIRCGMSFALGEGGPTWIHRYDEAGRWTYAILFRWSDHDQYPAHPNPRPIVEGEKRTCKVYRETVQNRLIRRVELNADEIAHEFEEIEKYLIGFLGEEKYRFYYQGGEPDELDEPEEPEIDASNADPFAADASEKKVVSVEEAINRINHYHSQSIATLIRSYREEAKELEEGAGKRD